MNEKVSASRIFSPTGTQLLFGLSVIVTAVVALLDYRFQHHWLNSLLLPFMSAALGVAAIGFGAIPKLSQLKMGQFIREDGPQAHLKKAGTPTMGGVFIVPVGLLAAILWSGFNSDVLALSLITASYLAIGGVDDWKSLSNRKNEGLKPKGKLALQVGAAIAFCAWAYLSKSESITTINFPLGLRYPSDCFFGLWQFLPCWLRATPPI